MKFHRPNHDLFVRRRDSAEAEMPKVTHLAIGAHQDDVEIFALHGILECFRHGDRNFGAVIVTDGTGSARTGRYAGFSDDEMGRIRVEEQRRAAEIGDYAFVAQLGYSSAEIKEATEGNSVDDLLAILEACAPETLYVHNPFDKHETHIAVLGKCLRAVRRLPRARRPVRVFGCEVWRDLDWLPDRLKVALPVDDLPDLGLALLAVFDSQISGGKRYDLAAEGRRLANATFLQSHDVDQTQKLTFAVDLSSVFNYEFSDPGAFLSGILEQFREEILVNAERYLNQ